MDDETPAGRDLERELVEQYPDLALLLRRTAQLHAWRPSALGEQVLRRLAGAVAVVIEQQVAPAEAEAYVAAVMEETQRWLEEQRRAHGRQGTRVGYGR
jgi:hypothetical protein